MINEQRQVEPKRIHARLIGLISILVIACTVASAQQLRSGTYRVDTISSDGQRYSSTWSVSIYGNRIQGKSEWDCCPGRRVDPLDGRIDGDRVSIERQCTGQGVSGPCYQVYEGTIQGNVIQGGFTTSGNPDGQWTLYLDRYSGGSGGYGNTGRYGNPGYGNPGYGTSSGYGSLNSGTYRVDTVTDDGQRYSSTWRLQISGNRIRGDSDWDCCPGRRTDRLRGSMNGDRVTIERQCRGQGMNDPCLQVYEGRIQGNGVEGGFTHNGVPKGRWTLYLSDSGYYRDGGYQDYGRDNRGRSRNTSINRDAAFAAADRIDRMSKEIRDNYRSFIRNEGRYRRDSTSSQLESELNTFRDAAHDVRERIRRERDPWAVQSPVQSLLEQGRRIDNLMSRSSVNDEVAREWADIRSNLQALSDAYGLRGWSRR